jgi:hypothetical protein
MHRKLFKAFFTGFAALALVIIPAFSAKSQTGRSTGDQQAPATITIVKADFDRLMDHKKGDRIAARDNAYLNGSEVMMNTATGDMKYLRIKLSGLHNAYLTVQVNGEYSTQVFVLSDDHSVSYKGKIGENGLVLTRCEEDEIVSE